MKKYRIFSFLIVFVLLVSLMTPCFATEETESASGQSQTSSPVENLPTGFEKPEKPTEYHYALDFTIQAKGAALVELNSNSLVYGYELDRQLYPASLTKIMTTMLALEHGNLDDVLTVSKSAMQGLSIHGSTAGLLVGEEITLRELLYCIMVSSANEGCNVVAEYVSGSVEEFVQLMNDKAAFLGMKGTHFANTHGLHNEAHYTTVRDLTTLACWAWQNMQFREFATTTRHTVPATNKSDERLLRTTNYLTDNRVVGRYYYDKAAGIKTGFTTPAGGCLISTASDGDMTFLSVVCGCETVYDEHGDPIDMRFSESKRLLKYGLEKFSYVQVLSDTIMLEQVQVMGGEKAQVLVHPKENVSIPMPPNADLTAITMELRYDEGRTLTAPVAAGQKVGTVVAKYEGMELASCDLVTLTAVKKYVAPAKPSKNNQSITLTPNVPVVEQKGGLWQTLKKLWFVTVPLGLILLIVCWILILRAINIRKAKKRAQQRRRRRMSR